MDEPNEAPENRELYALLNLSPEASDEEIRRAYRQWAQAYHPDKYQAPHVCFSTTLYAFFSFLFLVCNFLQFVACLVFSSDERYCYGELSTHM